jgi:hypothetical protein
MDTCSDTTPGPSGVSSSNTSEVVVHLDAEPPAALYLFSHEFPSGSLQDFFRRLHRRAKLPGFPLLARFLGDCASVLKQAVERLPRPLRDSVPPFHDLITLTSRWEDLRKSQVGGAWEGALVCTYEMAMLIG